MCDHIPFINYSVIHLLNDFILNPYIHRVEHSLHCELYGLITKELATIPKTNRLMRNIHDFNTQLVHKEWPHQNGIDKSLRRGNYDLVVLDYPSLMNCSLNDYLVGKNIDITSVIELGLNYPTSHIEKDCITLSKTKAKNKWIIHFRNIKSRKSSIKKHREKINDCSCRYNDISFIYAWVILENDKIKLIDKEIIQR